MADVLLLADSPAAVDGVRRALRHATAGGACHTLRCVHGWADLSRVAGTVAAGLALVDPYHGGALAQAEIWRLRTRHPALELVAYADFTGRPAGDPFTLAQLSVRAVVPRGAPDEAARLAACLDGAPGWTPLEALIERMRGLLPASVHGWLEPVLRSPLEPRTVPGLARRAGCSPRTLRRTLAAAGLPSPEQLLAWRRLLHAARLLEDPGRSVESVARALDLSSGAALRKTLKAMAGCAPATWGRAAASARWRRAFWRRAETTRLPAHGTRPAAPTRALRRSAWPIGERRCRPGYRCFRPGAVRHAGV